MRKSFRLTIGVLALVLSACAAPLRIAEQPVKAHDEGTLLLGEIVLPLSRDEILRRYPPADLESAGWNVADVVDGSAVVLSNFAQSNQTLFGWQLTEGHGFYALIRRESFPEFGSHQKCGPVGGCRYGGDAVSVRVVRKAAGPGSPTGLNLVEAMVEPADVTGDCQYVNRGEFKPKGYCCALLCKSLLKQGWDWDGDELVKRPAISAGK